MLLGERSSDAVTIVNRSLRRSEWVIGFEEISVAVEVKHLPLMCDAMMTFGGHLGGFSGFPTLYWFVELTNAGVRSLLWS